MNLEVVQDIKTEMVNAIIFYGRKFSNTAAWREHFNSSDFDYSPKSETDIQSLTTPIFYYMHAISSVNYDLRDFVRNRWISKGFSGEAKKAFAGVNEALIIRHAKKLGVHCETANEFKDRKENRKPLDGNDVWVLFLYAMVAVIVVGLLLRIFGFTSGSSDPNSTVRYEICKDAGDLGDQWDCQEAFKKKGI